MLKVRCTLPKHAKNCLHKSTTAKCSCSTKSDNDLSEKKREKMVGGSSIFFYKESACELNSYSLMIKLAQCWKVATQHKPYSTCQAMRAGLYTTQEPDFESGKFERR